MRAPVIGKWKGYEVRGVAVGDKVLGQELESPNAAIIFNSSPLKGVLTASRIVWVDGRSDWLEEIVDAIDEVRALIKRLASGEAEDCRETVKRIEVLVKKVDDLAARLDVEVIW